jgi:hypothetical protein
MFLIVNEQSRVNQSTKSNENKVAQIMKPKMFDFQSKIIGELPF